MSQPMNIYSKSCSRFGFFHKLSTECVAVYEKILTSVNVYYCLIDLVCC